MTIHHKKQDLSIEQWLRWGEFGTVLAIIPGTLLSILTGQFAFVASPLTVSLWLNLFCRHYRDRHTLQLFYGEQQSVMHRFESVLESTRRDRADWLINHPSELEERDLPQFSNVINFRLQCVEKNREALQTYLVESRQTVQEALQDIQVIQDAQSQSLKLLTQRLESLALLASEQQATRGRLQTLSDQFDRVQSVLSPGQHQLAKLRGHLVALEQSLNALESQEKSVSVDEPDIQAIWRSLETPILSRLDELKSQWLCLEKDRHSSERMRHGDGNESSINQQLETMHGALTEQLNVWEALHQDRENQLQQLNERLTTLEPILEKIHQIFLEESAQLEKTLILSQPAVMDCSDLEAVRSLNADSLKARLEELQRQLETQVQHSPFGELNSMLMIVEDSAKAKIEQINAMVTRSSTVFQKEQLDIVLIPLLQHLSDCDEKLSQITQTHSSQAVEETLSILEPRVQEISHRTEVLKSNRLASLMTHYDDLHVQLSTIRFKTEALKSQVRIEIDQIPDLIENYLRERRPIRK